MSYPAGPALALFAAAAPGRSGAEIAAALAMPGVRVGKRIGADLPKRDPDTGAPLPLLPCPFAAILLAPGPASARIPALRTTLNRAAGAIDLAGSVLLIGIQHIVTPGDGAILVTMLTRRRADFTPAAYRARWLNEHASFGQRVDATGYRQLHADSATCPGLPPADRFDGAGMIFFSDPDQMASARAAPEVAQDATRDEMRFIDHAGSMLAMFDLS
ncbi:MAG: EthD domain-containing protein [Sphingomonas sp.]|jgi:hypothetical protein|uniref:EthD domain-containing protein n=1 Tax=Sphingomonas sp. TaxID=28214 RepID=UPI00356291B9